MADVSGRGPVCFYTSRTLRPRLVVSLEAVGRLRVVQVVFIAVRSARRAVFSISGIRVAVRQVARRGDRIAVVNKAGADGQEPSSGSIGRVHESLPSSQARSEATAERQGRRSPPARFSPRGATSTGTRRTPVYLWRLVQARGASQNGRSTPWRGGGQFQAGRQRATRGPDASPLLPLAAVVSRACGDPPSTLGVASRDCARGSPFSSIVTQRSLPIAVISAVISTIGGDADRPRAPGRTGHTPRRARPTRLKLPMAALFRPASRL
jgi:hypothetical protein